MKKAFYSVTVLLAAAILMIGFSGCGDAGGTAKTRAPVTLSIQSFQYLGLYVDVNTNIPEKNTATLANQSKDPDLETSYLTDILVQGYEISFFRKDTGIAVPKTFTESCTTTIGSDSTADVEFWFCRLDMKDMPPLSYLGDFGYEPDTGLTVIHAVCKVIFWGKTLAGQEVVSNPGYFSVHFYAP